TLITSGASPAVQNGAAVTIDVPDNDDQLVLRTAIQNTSAAPSGTSSIIHVTGNGVLQLDVSGTGASAYSGSWNIDHSIINNETGVTLLNATQALGAPSGGTAAGVTLSSGYLTDLRSAGNNRVPNPITFNGGYLNTSATGAGISRSGAAFSGTIVINDVPAGSGVDMRDIFLSSPRNLSMSLSGV